MGDFPNITPAEMLDYWVKPELLVSWWAPQADVEAKTGGNYILSWPEMNWVLLGKIESLEPACRLVFSWKWNFEPKESAPLVVSVEVESIGSDGTRIKITHSGYVGDAKKTAGHLEGWQHFCARLREVLARRKS